MAIGHTTAASVRPTKNQNSMDFDGFTEPMFIDWNKFPKRIFICSIVELCFSLFKKFLLR